MLFGLIIRLRHLFYDKGWKKSYASKVRTVCVGNLALGGTGKTPMIELMLRTLLEENTVPGTDRRPELAVLSRGYGRRTKGFRLLPACGSADLYGDEPMQIKRKFPQVTVAVDEDRVEGCRLLVEAAVSETVPDLILLDDAMQHRRLVPSATVLLTTFDRPFFRDRLVPWGRLRDIPSRSTAADVVVVTKCPPELEVDEDMRRQWTADMGLRENQPLLFATTVYDEPKPVFDSGDSRYLYARSAIMFTGIANDIPLRLKLEEKYKVKRHFAFEDHHIFNQDDVDILEKAARKSPNSVMFTTEKDARRIRDAVTDGNVKVSGPLMGKMFVIPIRMQFLSAEEDDMFKKFLNLQLNKNTES